MAEIENAKIIELCQSDQERGAACALNDAEWLPAIRKDWFVATIDEVLGTSPNSFGAKGAAGDFLYRLGEEGVLEKQDHFPVKDGGVVHLKKLELDALGISHSEWKEPS